MNTHSSKTNASDFTGKVVVITSASDGFGKGIAINLARRGANLILGARAGDLPNELGLELPGVGGHVRAVNADVSRVEDIERLATVALDHHGRIDVWINDAGVGALSEHERVPLELREEIGATNLVGAIYGSYAAIKQFHMQGYGTLINLSSTLGKTPMPYATESMVSKCGVAGLGTALRQALHVRNAQNIHVCTVFPMPMDTPFVDQPGLVPGHPELHIEPAEGSELVVETIVGLINMPKDEIIVGRRGEVREPVPATGLGTLKVRKFGEVRGPGVQRLSSGF